MQIKLLNLKEEVLNIPKKSIVSIVGSGGKTTLMFSIADVLKFSGKVLVTTTTKIYCPNKGQYDFLCTDVSKFGYYNKINKNGIYVYGKMIDKLEKIIGVDCNILNEESKYFDYILIESDGSKQKDIKGWRRNEPVIVEATDITVGILSIKSLGKKINTENVFRVNEFMDITGSSLNETINIGHLVSLVFNNNGIFKNARGKKILFINKVESLGDKKKASDLIDEICDYSNHIGNSIDKILYGSLKG